MKSESTMPPRRRVFVSTRVMCAVAVALSFLIFSSFLVGAGNEPKIEVVPSSVELPSPGAETEVLVILRNPTGETLNCVVLNWLTDRDLKVAPLSPRRPIRLAPQAASAWTLKIAQARQEPVSGSLRLRVDYTTLSAGKRVPHVLAQSVSVKNREFELMDLLVGVDVKTTLESLDAYHRGVVHLVINSKLGRPSTLTITPGGPDFICFDPKGVTCEPPSPNRPPPLPPVHEILLDPYETRLDTFAVGASKSVEPGKYLLVFTITIKPDQQGGPTRSMIKTQEVEVGVLGESVILKVLGVPSFLLLPGCLLVLTTGLLWKTGLLRYKTADDEFLLEYNSPYFWLVSITFSGLMAFGFRWYSGRWYFVRYGLDDIVGVWLGSIFLGALSFVGLLLLRRWLETSRTPSEDDDPITILRKLHQQNLGLMRDSYTLKGKEGEPPAFLVQKPPEGDAKLWLSPGILVDLVAVADPVTRKQTLDELRPEGDPHRLADLLSRYKKAVDWEPQPLPGVRAVARDKIAADAERDIIISER